MYPPDLIWTLPNSSQPFNMPRDSKGQLFGIGSTVTTPDGPLVVRGFATSRDQADTTLIATIAKSAGLRSYNWRDITNTNPAEYAHKDSTDCCPVDKAVVAFGIEATAALDGDGDKVVWGE